MTYLEYSKQLVTELGLKKANTLNLYAELLAGKDHLDPYETDLHLARVMECHEIANLAELVMKDLLNGSISPFDPID